MKWHRDTSYHNGRHYDEDAPGGPGVNQLKLTLAWLIDAARRGLEGMFGRGRSRPLDRIFLRPGNAPGLTVLGSAASRHAVNENSPSSPFPAVSEEAAQLDRWADEGGAIGPAPIPRARKRADKVSSHVGDTNR